MEAQQQSSAVVKDLIIINNDRYEGYMTAAKETKDSDLQSLFTEFANQSKKFAEELRRFVPANSDQPERDETKNTGKLYRVWMDLKAAVSGHDRKTVLDNCEFGEDAAQKAYDMALNSDEEIEAPIRELIVRQKTALKSGHDEVKRLRDMHKANH